ncbi:MAG: M3 family metallopeptidase [Candidatus Thorarchaeota archaeon]|jgi:thimet oligopeptidase
MTEQGIIRKPDWTIDPATMRSIAVEEMKNKKEKLDEIAKTPAGKVGLKTLQDFEEVLGSDDPLGYFLFIKHVSSNKEQRDMADDIEKEVRKFYNEIWGRKDLYDVIVQLEPEMESLDPEEKTLLDKTLKEFRHRGAALDDDKRKEFLEIANNITVLQSEYGRVLNEITTTIPFTEEELEGVPLSVYENMEKDEDKYLCSLDYPVYFPVVNYAKNPETRKKMMITSYQKGGKENSERLSDALALRDRQAKLLGHSNFAEYVILRKMAKTPQRVIDFLNDLKERLTPLSEKENLKLRELKAKDLNTPLEDTRMELWDIFYYHEMLRKDKYAVDQNEVKEYFPASQVVEGVLDVYQTVLNLEFVEADKPNTWHEDVMEFKVIDKTNDQTLGVFYLDLYPREGKFKHYAVWGLMDRRVKDGKAYLPMCAMVSNYEKPTKDKPSLLTHNDVETFFHEFGHLMHVICNQANYARFGLDGVLPDFIETPSMMFENWAWKEKVLAKLSGHYDDAKKKLPSELLKRMIDAKLLNVGTLQLRQVAYSLIDMLYHTEGVDDTSEAFRRIFGEITGYEMPEEVRMDAGFGHFMNTGYTAGYYSYLWSKAYAEDVFTKFEEKGFMKSEIGTEYRQKILAPGGSLDPDEMVKSFLGREMNTDAFMKSLGLNGK